MNSYKVCISCSLLSLISWGVLGFCLAVSLCVIVSAQHCTALDSATCSIPWQCDTMRHQSSWFITNCSIDPLLILCLSGCLMVTNVPQKHNSFLSEYAVAEDNGGGCDCSCNCQNKTARWCLCWSIVLFVYSFLCPFGDGVKRLRWWS